MDSKETYLIMKGWEQRGIFDTYAGCNVEDCGSSSVLTYDFFIHPRFPLVMLCLDHAFEVQLGFDSDPSKSNENVEKIVEDSKRAESLKKGKAWRDANPDYNRLYAASHKEEVKANHKKWYERNRDSRLAYQKKRWQEKRKK